MGGENALAAGTMEIQPAPQSKIHFPDKGSDKGRDEDGSLFLPLDLHAVCFPPFSDKGDEFLIGFVMDIGGLQARGLQNCFGRAFADARVFVIEELGQIRPIPHGCSDHVQIQIGVGSAALPKNELTFGPVQPTPSKTTALPPSIRSARNRRWRSSSLSPVPSSALPASRPPQISPEWTDTADTSSERHCHCGL